MEDLPLNLSMRFFSEDYAPCVTRASGWCNIPNKARFNPTEQIIIAYHKGTVVYATKVCLIGTFTVTGVELYY